MGVVHRSRHFDHAPFLIVGTYRSEEVKNALEKLLRIDGINTLELARLSPEAVTTIIRFWNNLSPKLFVSVTTKSGRSFYPG